MKKNPQHKIWIVAVILLFAIYPLSNAQLNISEQTEADVIIKNFETKETIIFSMDDFIFETFNGYDVVRLIDGVFINEIGKPMLPSQEIKIALPDGMTAQNIRVEKTEEVEIPGQYSIIPGQHPLKTDCSSQNIEFVEPDVELYSSNIRYPTEVARFLIQTDLYGQSMAVIQLFPIQYVPSEKKLILHESITIEIEGVDGYVCGDYAPITTSPKDLEKYEERVKDMVINPEDVVLTTYSPGTPMKASLESGDYDYVIITQDSWVDYFQPLADWKTRKGVSTKIVTLTWIYSEYIGSTNQDKIQAFVEDASSPLTWEAKYFLLGGDTNVVPYQTKHYYLSFSGQPAEHVYAPSDTYYADYDQDFIVEVNVGRACVRDTGEISTFIDKILTYEQNPPLTDYAKRAALFGFDLDSNTHGEIVKIAINSSYIPSGWTVKTEYDSESGTHKVDVINYLNSGNNLVNHIDHCSAGTIGTGYTNHWEYLSEPDVMVLSNGDKQSIFYTTGCDPAAFDENTCIAEHFVQNADGGGIAFVGNSRYGVYVQGQYNTYSNRYDKRFFESLFTDGYYILGECHSDHKNDAPVGDNYYKLIFDELNLLGDPELPVWTENPISLDVTHPATLPAGPSSFTVHVEVLGSDLQDAFVCLWKGDQVYLTGYTDVNGDATFLPSPSSGGTMYVTVTKHNYLPYLGQADAPYHNPPYPPSNPDPANNSINIDVHADLSWTCSDPEGEPLTFDLYFGTTNPPPQESTGLTDPSYDPGKMQQLTKYYWYIVAHDNDPTTDPTQGPTWEFTTKDATPPEWQNQGQSETEIGQGDSNILSSQGKDNLALTWAWLSTNETGVWQEFTGDWWDFSWIYRKKITIDHNKVEALLVDFPVLVSFISTDLIGHTQENGEDIVFVDATNTNKYDHEIEHYDSTTGELVAWVKIPLLSSTDDTELWLYYGKPDCNDQQNPSGVWDNGFTMIYHMNDDDTDTTVVDSTSVNNDGVKKANAEPTRADGKIGKCQEYDGTDDYINIPDLVGTGKPITVEIWFNIKESNTDNDLAQNLIDFRGEYKEHLKFQRTHDTLNDMSFICTTGDPAQSEINSISYGTWYYSVMVVDDITDDFYNYLDGNLKDSNDNLIEVSDKGSNRLGSAAETLNKNEVDGKIDEVRFSNGIRSSGWIKTTYNNQNDPDSFMTVGSEQHGGVKYDSPMYLGGTSQEWTWSNFTWQNITITERTVGWKIFYIDSIGNINSTDVMSFVVNQGTDKPPEITNVDDSPDPQEVYGYVNITADVTDDIGVVDVFLNITHPDSSFEYFSITENKIGDTYYCNRAYSTLGTYYYFIWANDTIGNENTSDIYSFVIQDTTPPEITNVDDSPDPQEVYGYVNITADVTDDIGVSEVFLNITHPDSSFEYFSITENKIGDTYYCNRAYSTLGTYYYFIWANDTIGNENTSDIYSFVIQDTTPPEITNVEATPAFQGVDGYVNITCDVNDNFAVEEVIVNITYPDSTSQEYPMNPGSYYFNQTYSQEGIYSFYIKAKDTSENDATSDIYQFEINSSTIRCGDCNNDGIVDLGDIVYLINYLFKQPWPEPQPMLCVGDVNNDDVVDLGDVVYLLNYLFKQPWPEPNPECCS